MQRTCLPEVLLGGCGSDPAEVSGAFTLIGGSCGGAAVTGDVWFGTKTAPPEAWRATNAGDRKVLRGASQE